MAKQDKAQGGKGVTAFWWNASASPPAYQTLGKIRKISPIGVDDAEIESSTLDSEIEDSVPGLGRGKEVMVTDVYNAESVARFEAIKAAGVDFTVKLVWPSPASLTRYVDVSPRGIDYPEVGPNTLQEISLKTKMVGIAPTATDPHA